MTTRFSIALVACLFAAPALARPAASNPEASALLATANEKAAIAAPGAKPFRLVADVLVRGEWKGERRGQVTVTWLAPDRWRLEETLPDYHEVRVADAGKLRIQRTPIGPEERSEWPASLLAWRLFEPPPQQGQRVRAPSKRGTLTCVAVDDPDAERTFHCIDASGLVVRVESPGTIVYEMSDAAPFEGHDVPRTYRILRGRILAVEMKVTTLEAIAKDAAFDATVEAPDGEWPYCASYAVAVPTSWPVTYPPRAASEDLQGLVTVEMTIGADGRATSPRLVRATNYEQLDEQVVKATERWLFLPALCDNTPVASPLRVSIDYRLQHWIPWY